MTISVKGTAAGGNRIPRTGVKVIAEGGKKIKSVRNQECKTSQQ